MTNEIMIGKLAPAFKALASTGEELSLSDFRGKKVVLYFYPKDATSGCTLEAQNFRDYQQNFKKLNTVILGVSRDSINSHLKFIEKEKLNFILLSDPQEKLCQAYDVIKDKIMYGKKVRGIERSTFLIDERGKIQFIWRKIKVPGHVDSILTKIQENEH